MPGCIEVSDMCAVMHALTVMLGVCVFSGIAQRARSFLIGIKSLTEAHRGKP